MSKESYVDGFCKVARANNIDPYALARYAFEKDAQDAGGKGIWAQVLDYLKGAGEKAKKWYGERSQNEKALLGAGAGALAGGGIGAAIGGKKGLGLGALLGAGGGGLATGVKWDEVLKAIKGKKDSQPGNDSQPGTDSANGSSGSGKTALGTLFGAAKDLGRKGNDALKSLASKGDAQSGGGSLSDSDMNVLREALGPTSALNIPAFKAE